MVMFYEPILVLKDFIENMAQYLYQFFLAERATLINVLPGGYVEKLGKVLNPLGPNNWVQLAYHFKLTLTQVNNMKISSPDCTQELLYHLGSKNTTVEGLYRGLKAIKRDDACLEFINFMKSERNDDESAIVFMNDCE